MRNIDNYCRSNWFYKWIDIYDIVVLINKDYHDNVMLSI